MSTAMHDYTREDAPFGDDNPDEFVIAGNATAVINKTADEIEKENSFVDMPPGEHLVIVAGFSGPPKPLFTKVTLNGQMASFDTNSIMVRFALPDNPKCSITDFFVLPPANDNQLRAYFEGVPEGKKAAGWAASKFIHFINRLGYVWAPGQPFPDAARKLGAWKGRPIILKVDAAEPYKDPKTGEQKMGRPSVRSFSYRPASEGLLTSRPSTGSPTGTGSRAAAAARPALVGSPVGAVMDNGLDNI